MSEQLPSKKRLEEIRKNSAYDMASTYAEGSPLLMIVEERAFLLEEIERLQREVDTLGKFISLNARAIADAMNRAAVEPKTEYECNNDKCNWTGPVDDTVHPKHMTDTLLCPECYETVERR